MFAFAYVLGTLKKVAIGGMEDRIMGANITFSNISEQNEEPVDLMNEHGKSLLSSNTKW